jgi:hypothetical protein
MVKKTLLELCVVLCAPRCRGHHIWVKGFINYRSFTPNAIHNIALKYIKQKCVKTTKKKTLTHKGGEFGDLNYSW